MGVLRRGCRQGGSWRSDAGALGLGHRELVAPAPLLVLPPLLLLLWLALLTRQLLLLLGLRLRLLLCLRLLLRCRHLPRSLRPGRHDAPVLEPSVEVELVDAVHLVQGEPHLQRGGRGEEGSEGGILPCGGEGVDAVHLIQGKPHMQEGGLGRREG